MSTKTLYLAWQDRREKGWFPVGRLDIDVDSSDYCFGYIRGAKRAIEEVGFAPLLEFPNLCEKYRSSDLFPIFKNRVMSSKRPDFIDYVRSLDLPVTADPIQILSVSGGRRVTDSYEIFPKIDKAPDGSFTCRFFLHGWRYINSAAQNRIGSLKQDENLYVTLELTNPATGLAVQIQTENYHMIGWAPRYLVHDLASAMAESPTKYEAHVVRVNPQGAPINNRVLIEMNGCWNRHEPMSGDDFKPIVF
ncbi:MAG: DNA-binding protein [Chloroflexi bacterium]|nr:DNA-binding protein [Chloroflexota bacterium]